MRIRALFAVATLTLAAFGLVACGPQEQVDPAAEQAAEDLAWLKENKPLLDEKRQELQDVRARLADNVPEGEEEEEEAAEGETPTPEELEGRVNVLADEIESLTTTMGEKVISYLNNAGLEINQAGMIVGELTPDQQFVVDLKIEEDMAVAKEYIDKGGDYIRALDIYAVAKKLNADHEALNAAIASAEELRWMTEERFSQLKRNMSQDEVREILGQVNLRNVQEYEDQGRIGWFYKKEGGGAAGVFFKKRRGEWVVESFDFEAVEQQVIESDG